MGISKTLYGGVNKYNNKNDSKNDSKIDNKNDSKSNGKSDSDSDGEMAMTVLVWIQVKYNSTSQKNCMVQSNVVWARVKYDWSTVVSSTFSPSEVRPPAFSIR